MRGRQWAAVLVLAAGCAATAAAPPPAVPRRPPLHPVLLAYVTTLDEWTTDGERDVLGGVALEGTLGGDSQRLRYLAADRVVRRLLPLALEAQGRPELREYADRLRRLPPLLNRDTDAVAAPYVRVAIRALRGERVPPAREVDAMTEDDPERASLELSEPGEGSLEAAAESTDDPELEAALAEALAEYSDAYALSQGVSRLHADAAAAAASDTVDAGLLFRTAVAEWGVPREQALEIAAGLLSDMATAARRRERIPYVPRAEEPPADTVGPFGP